jgi:hypothetical protein
VTEPKERLKRVDERFAVTLAGYDQLLAEKGDDPAVDSFGPPFGTGSSF